MRQSLPGFSSSLLLVVSRWNPRASPGQKPPSKQQYVPDRSYFPGNHTCTSFDTVFIWRFVCPGHPRLAAERVTSVVKCFIQMPRSRDFKHRSRLWQGLRYHLEFAGKFVSTNSFPEENTSFLMGKFATEQVSVFYL